MMTSILAGRCNWNSLYISYKVLQLMNNLQLGCINQGTIHGMASLFLLLQDPQVQELCDYFNIEAHPNRCGAR